MSLRLFISVLAAASLSSCNVFKKNDTAQAADSYDAANAYNSGGYPPANAYGNTGGYDAGNTYGQPGSTPPPAYNPPANTGSGYDTSPYSGAGSAGNSASGRSHKVVKGDTLSGLGRRYGVSVDALKRANGLTSDTIRLDSTLVIP